MECLKLLLASNMVTMRAIIGRTFPIYVYGCQAHALNLVIQDYFSDGKRSSILQIANSGGVGGRFGAFSFFVLVLKAFRTSTTLSAALRDQSLPRPPVACATRWYTNEAVLQYYNLHWAFLAQVVSCFLVFFFGIDPFQVAASKLKPTDAVRRHLEDSQVSRSVLELLTVVGMVASCLGVMEKARPFSRCFGDQVWGVPCVRSMAWGRPRRPLAKLLYCGSS